MNKIHGLAMNENGWEINFIHSILKQSSIAIHSVAIFCSFSFSCLIRDLMFWRFYLYDFQSLIKHTHIFIEIKAHRIQSKRLAYLFISRSWHLTEHRQKRKNREQRDRVKVTCEFRHRYDYYVVCRNRSHTHKQFPSYEIMPLNQFVEDCNFRWISFCVVSSGHSCVLMASPEIFTCSLISPYLTKQNGEKNTLEILISIRSNLISDYIEVIPNGIGLC